MGSILKHSLGKIIYSDNPMALAKEIKNFTEIKILKKIKSKKKIIHKFSKFLTKNVSKEYEKLLMSL